MNILSIDSSGPVLSVGIMTQDKILTISDDTKSRASQTILNIIDKILKDNNLSSKDLNAIIFNKGPASFTGTRISSSIVQAIGYSNNIPVFGISSLSLMAHTGYVKYKYTKILCVKKAFSNLVYWAYFNIEKQKFSPLLGNYLTAIDKIKIESIDKFYIISDCKEKIYENKNLKKQIIENIDYKDHDSARKLINYVIQEENLDKPFNHTDTLPDYAGHNMYD